MRDVPNALLNIYQNNIPEVEGKQVALISRVLAVEINDGYQDISFWILKNVNGQKIRSMQELVAAIESYTGTYNIFENEKEQQIIINNEQASIKHDNIMI